MNHCYFECKYKGSCINESNHCEDIVGCRLIHNEKDKCAMCRVSNVCAYAKEMRKCRI